MGYSNACEIIETIDPLDEKIRSGHIHISQKELEFEELTLRLQDTKNSLRVFLGEYNDTC